MRGDVRTNGRFVYIKSESYFINRVSTLVTRITKRFCQGFCRGFCRGFQQGYLLVMPGGKTEGGSGGSSSASSSSGRTSIGCLESLRKFTSHLLLML